MAELFRLAKVTVALAAVEPTDLTVSDLIAAEEVSVARLRVLPSERIGDRFTVDPGDLIYLRNGIVTANRFAVGDEQGRMIRESLTLNVVPEEGALSQIRTHEGEPMTRLPGCWIALSNWSTSVYFHWFAQGLANLCIVRAATLPDSIRFITSRLLSWQREALRLAGCDLSLVLEVEDGVYQCEHLLYPTDLQNQAGVISQRMLQVCDEIRQEVVRTVRPEVGSQKVYVARFDSASRILDNEGALVDRLRQLGYTIVTTSNMDFCQEVLTFDRAKIIIGAAGSGMTNLAFARPGTTVLELNCLGQHYRLFQDLAELRQLRWNSILYDGFNLEMNPWLHWRIDDLDGLLERIIEIEATLDVEEKPADHPVDG